ncbi:hypothetical protein [Nostoc sp.]
MRFPRPRDRSSEVFVNIRGTVLERVMPREAAHTNHQLLQHQ